MEATSLTPMPHTAVLFDFDMTLADSSAGAIRCVNHALARMKLSPCSDDEIRRTIGLPLDRTFATLVPQSDPLRAMDFQHHFVEEADRCMVELTRVFPQVPALISWLRGRGWLTGIVSTKFRYRIEDILHRAGMAGLFDTIVGGEDVKAHKPDPSGLSLALARLGLPAERAVYVGDHPVDQQAARRAGMAFFAVLSGSSCVADFSAMPPERILSSVGDLQAALERGAFSCRQDLGL